MPFLAIATIPSMADMLSSISDYSSPTFDEFLPWIYLAVGVFVAVLIGLYLIRVVRSGFAHFSSAPHDTQGLMRHQARRRYLDLTDDRSERGDFLHEGE